MMKKNAKKNNVAKKLIPAAGMLALSASMLATSTYAWFTMNKEVTVTGMEVKTVVGDNLLIAKSATAATAVPAESAFQTADVDLLEAILEPVSTVDGKAFWYTSTFNVGGSGDALTDTYLNYTTAGLASATGTDASQYANAFSQNYGVKLSDTAEGYKDYAFFLKANNTDSATKNINVTDIDFTYGGDNDRAAHAFRTAIFVEDIGTDRTKAATADAGTLTTILSTEGNAAGSYYFTDGNAVNAANGLSTLSNYSSNATLATVAAGSTNYYKVVVRLWLEGEDEVCNNSEFNTLKDKWGLTLKIEMKANTENGVNKFDAVKTTTKTDLTAGGVSVATTATSIEGVDYYAITGATIDSKPLYANASTLASATRIYKLDGTHLIDVTNQCKLS